MAASDSFALEGLTATADLLTRRNLEAWKHPTRLA
jgi:hypothetical protein